MRLTTLPAVLLASLITVVLVTALRPVAAQNNINPATVGVASPLPVFVTNPQGQPVLPTGFQPGTRWHFTTWTSPSQIDWDGDIERVSGPWAYIRVNINGNATARWYYVPAMPGSWDPR